MLFPNVNRSELRERINIDDDALENLLKRGIIRSAGEGQGRGNRRSFRADDVMIAAVMSRLHRWGVGTPVLSKLSAHLYEATELGRTVVLKPGDARAARAAVDHHLALIAEDADAEFDAYYGPQSDGASAAGARASTEPDQHLSFSERLKDLDPGGLALLDIYLDLIDPAYLDDDPPPVRWEVAPDEEVPGRYRFNRVVGDSVRRRFPDKRTDWVTIVITELARRVWLGA